MRIRSLPASPGNASVTRADWISSFALRRYRSAPGATYSSGRSLARTSCWVIVEAPRWPEPLAFSAMADMIAAGSNPPLSQKVRSSAVVVASITSFGTLS